MFDLHHGNCLDILRTIPDCSIDAVVTDPPYGLSFMGKKWDYDVPSTEIWEECLRVLKPGGYLLAFAGTRTQHRMAVRIEDAGFEIRDMLAWMYGSGFPKSHNLDGEHQGWGTALKPAMEPITMARKSFKATVAQNVQKWGTGAINIDGCRIGERKSRRLNRSGSIGYGGSEPQGIVDDGGMGRWPANVMHDGSEDVLEGISEASRFFYCPKTSKVDRDHGCDAMEARVTRCMENPDTRDRPTPMKSNFHPTVKPTELMRYLCRLVTPKGGVVLDPFTGSGSTGRGAILEGFRFIGCEMDDDYIKIAEARIQAVMPKEIQHCLTLD
jgi:site-specific DNA-methyltransferase (adenine-specific)